MPYILENRFTGGLHQQEADDRAEGQHRGQDTDDDPQGVVVLQHQFGAHLHDEDEGGRTVMPLARRHAGSSRNGRRIRANQTPGAPRPSMTIEMVKNAKWYQTTTLNTRVRAT